MRSNPRANSQWFPCTFACHLQEGECFDPDTSMNGEGFIEVTDSDDNVIAEIYGYDIDEVDEDIINSNLI